MSTQEQPNHERPKVYQASAQDISGVGPAEVFRKLLSTMEPDFVAALPDGDPLKVAHEIAQAQRVLSNGVPETLNKRERERDQQAESMAFMHLLVTANSNKLNLHLIASHILTHRPELLPELTKAMSDNNHNHFVNQDYEQDEDYKERARLNAAGRRVFISTGPPPGVSPNID